MSNFILTTKPTQGAWFVSLFKNKSLLKYVIYRFIFVCFILLSGISLNATIYYVSATGNDSNTGTSTSLPWKTLTKVNSITPKAGDQILFKRGDSWIGTITVKASGTSAYPITYGAWGDGANPIISGFTTISDWTNEGNGVYSKAIIVESNPEIVTINGLQFAMGRTPNADRHNTKYSDYYHIDSFSGTTQITDSECNSSATDWDGANAELVVRTANYMNWGVFPIKSHSGTTLTFDNSGSLAVENGFGYFIQNDIRTLDQFGEWYYGNGKLYMYFGSANPSEYIIKASSKNTCVNINTKNYITLTNLKIEGSNVDAISIPSGGTINTTIVNCNFDFNHTGIRSQMAYDLTVKNCTFQNSTHMAIYQHWYSDGTYFGYNKIDNTGLILGAGESSWYTGISAMITYSKHTYSQKNTIIEHNTITNSGYMGLMFSGDNAVVKNNYIDTYGLNKSDCGGIYHGNKADLTNMSIDHNIVLNGVQNNENNGLPIGSLSNKQYNIYIDYFSTGGFTVTNNTVAHSQGGGIMIHGSQNVNISNNTVYDCETGIRFQELDGLGYPSRNISMDNNVVLAKTISQICVWARSTTNDFNQYGTFSNNYYAKPVNNAYPFATLVNTWANTYHNLAGWQSFTSLDASSQLSAQTITSVNDLQFEYNTSDSSKIVSLTQPMIDVKGTKYSSEITLQPFSSAVLMKDLNPDVSELTKPVITDFSIPFNYSSLVVPINTLTVVSNQIITGYKLSESANIPSVNDESWTSTVPSSYTFSSLGTKTLYAWVKDAKGNISASACAQVFIQKNLGYTDVYSTSTTSTARLAMPVTLSEAGEINSISIYHNGGTGNMILAVYSDLGGYPSSLLGITASTTINSKAGWQTVNLKSPVATSSGQKVWLSWVFQTNPGIRYTSGTPGRAASSGYWVSGMPANYGTSTIAGNKYSIYCSYMPVNQTDVTNPIITTFVVPATSSSLSVSVTSFTASDNKGVSGYLITESATAPMASNSGWSTSAPASYTFASEGTKTLYAWSKDAAGNVSASISTQVTITLPDVTKPVVTAFTVPSTSTSLSIAVTSFTASDNKGVTGYLLTESSNVPLVSNPGWSASAPASYTFASEGTKTLYAWSKDAAGNVSASISTQVTITLPDVNKPVVTAFSVPSTSTSLSIAVTSFTASDNKGVTGYLLTESSNVPLVSNPGWSASAPASYTFASEGAKTLYAWSKDAAGNVSASISAQVVIELPDVNKPVVTAFSVPSTSTSLSIAVTSFTASDNKGVTGYLLTESSNVPLVSNPGWSASAPASYTFASEGTKTLYAWSKDAAGNVSASISTQVVIELPDVTKPVVTAFTVPSTSTSLSIAVTSFTASDNKGVTGYLLTESSNVPLVSNPGWSASAPASYTFASEGTKTLYAWSKDAAGNVSASISAQVVIELPDVNKPVVTAFSVPSTSTSLSIAVTSFTASDNKGVTGYLLTESSNAPLVSNPVWSASAPASYTFASEGTKTLYAWSKDAAGNVSASISAQVVIELPDVNKPVVTAFSVPSTSTSLSIAVTSFTASDNKGVTGYLLTESSNVPLVSNPAWSASAPASYTFASEGTKTLYAWSKDAAGNVSASISAQVVIELPDVNKPVVTAFAIPATSSSLSVSVTSFTASDNKSVSGYLLTESATAPLASNSGWSASAPASYTFASEGTKTLYAWSKDAAGNVSASISAQVVIELPDVTKPVVTAFSVPSTSTSLSITVTSFTASDNKGVTGYLLTESSNVPLVSNPGWSASAPGSYTFASEGAKTLYAWSKDAAGNVSTSISAQVNIELIKPLVTNFSIPDTTETLTIPIIKFEVNDKNIVTGYIITETSNSPLANEAGWTLTAPANYSFSSNLSENSVSDSVINEIENGLKSVNTNSVIYSNGITKTLYAWTKDACGNISKGVSDKIVISLPDVTKPIVTTFAIMANSSSLIVEINSFTATDNKGVTGYLLTESVTAPIAGNAGWSASAPASYTFASEGTKTLYAWSKDAAGNVSASISAQVVIELPDVTKPVVNAFTLLATSSSLSVSVTSFTASDNKSVSGYLLTESASAPLASNSGWSASAPASYTFASEGTKTLYAWSKDAAGNVSASISAQVTITLPDVTKPVVTAFAIPATSSSLSVSVTSFTASDNKSVSGYLLTESATAPLASNSGWSASASALYTFATEGTKTLFAWAKDAEGNVSESLNAQIRISIPSEISEFSVGNTEIFSNTLKWANRLAMPVVLTKAGEIQTISIYHDGGTGNFLLGVYSDKGGYPSTLLGVTALTNVNSNAGWQTVQLKSPVPVIASQKVWLSWVFQNTPGLRYTSGNPGRAASSNTWTNGMPASFGSSNIAPNKYSIYCTLLTNNNSNDLTAPIVNSFSIPATSTELTVTVNSLTATDNLSVMGYMITESNVSPMPGDAGWSTNIPTSHSFSTEGTKILYAWAKDASGNVSVGKSAQVIISLPANTEISLGNTDVYSNSITWGNLLAMPVSFTEDGEIKSISIYHNGGTGNFLLGIYSDNNGNPSSKISVTASTVVNSSAGWQTVQLINPVSVVSGQKVWLSWVFQNNPGIRYTYGSPGRAASSNTWANGMPVSFGTSTIAPTKYSVYCSFTPNSTKSGKVLSENASDLIKTDLKVYPNPFTDRLHFDFVSPESVNARIDLYDMTGRLVSTIFEQFIEEKVKYEADFRPATSANTFYIYRIIMGNKTTSGKVIFKKE